MQSQTKLPSSLDGRGALDVAQEAATAAGAIIATSILDMNWESGRAQAGVSQKAEWNNLVTNVDKDAEATILQVLLGAFPHHSVLAEESGTHVGTDQHQWVIDPLDGTRNFANGLPHVAVNIGLVSQGKLLLGLTLDPVRNEMFVAINGGGCWLNNHPISTIDSGSLREAVVGTDMGYLNQPGKNLLAMIHDLWPNIQSVRMMGSAALGLAYVACGRLSLYAHHYVQPWDIAPGMLLVQEAGGIVTNITGQPSDYRQNSIIAGAPNAHAAFITATSKSDWRDNR